MSGLILFVCVVKNFCCAFCRWCPHELLRQALGWRSFSDRPSGETLVFLCCQAAQAHAKRGENIDRRFIGESPGGVGQSLYSSHLNAVCGQNHAFIDPNIWYDEQELLKQIEQFAGCFILTAQEATETSRRMREDHYKKTMSADGMAGRRPYGYVTRMIADGGEPFDVVQRHFRAQLSFDPAAQLSLGSPCSLCMPPILGRALPRCSGGWILPKNPTLKDFRVSGPAIASKLVVCNCSMHLSTHIRERHVST